MHSGADVLHEFDLDINNLPKDIFVDIQQQQHPWLCAFPIICLIADSAGPHAWRYGVAQTLSCV